MTQPSDYNYSVSKFIDLVAQRTETSGGTFRLCCVLLCAGICVWGLVILVLLVL